MNEMKWNEQIMRNKNFAYCHASETSSNVLLISILQPPPSSLLAWQSKKLELTNKPKSSALACLSNGEIEKETETETETESCLLNEGKPEITQSKLPEHQHWTNRLSTADNQVSRWSNLINSIMLAFG